MVSPPLLPIVLRAHTVRSTSRPLSKKGQGGPGLYTSSTSLWVVTSEDTSSTTNKLSCGMEPPRTVYNILYMSASGSYLESAIALRASASVPAVLCSAASALRSSAVSTCFSPSAAARLRRSSSTTAAPPSPRASASSRLVCLWLSEACAACSAWVWGRRGVGGFG